MKRALEIFRDGKKHDGYLITPLLDGEQGNMQTLAAMRDIVVEDRLQPDLRTFVLREVVPGISGHDPWRQLDAVHAYARDRIVYQQDPFDVERVADLWSTLYGLRPSTDGEIYQPEGDCGIKSMFIATCAAILGHRPLFVVIKQDEGSGSFSHVFNVVFVNGEGRYYDATPQDAPPGWKAKAMVERWCPIFE